jgi:hypothetical protein
MVLALVRSILYGFLSLKQTARTVEAFQRVDLPGTATVELDHHRRATRHPAFATAARGVAPAQRPLADAYPVVVPLTTD